MLHLHHLNNSRSFRILWLLEVLELEYCLTEYSRDKNQLAPRSLTKIHPLGKAPILQDGDKTLVESAAIINYILDKYDTDNRLRPPYQNELWHEYDFWMHFCEASMMPPLVMRFVFRIVSSQAPLLVKPIASMIELQVSKRLIGPNLKKILKFTEQYLTESLWLVGNSFSAADIQVYFALKGANASNLLTSGEHRYILNWLNRCEHRDDYQRAVNKGGELEF